MVVYPAGVWYQPRTPADIDEIVQSHFVEGRPVERLIVVPKR
jgi:(2Fe-2S) ferredoxin